MKKISIFLVSVLFTVALNAQVSTKSKKIWHPIVEAIATVESGQDPTLVSKSGKYVGYLQISSILVKEVNNILGKSVYTNMDRLDKDKSIEMFIIIQEHYNPERNAEKAIRLWNSGDKNCMKCKTKTQGYYNKVSKLVKGGFNVS